MKQILTREPVSYKREKVLTTITSIMSDPKTNVIQEMFFNFADDLSKKRTLEVCSSHLQGSWSSLTQDDIDLNVIQTGFVNRLFLSQQEV